MANEEAVIKRIQPHNTEAERAVIGSMIMDQDAIVAASEIISGEDFYQRPYGILFDENADRISKENAKKDLKTALSQQVKKIAEDYIIKGMTCLYAIMFIPNDGLYAYIQSDDDLYQNVISLARKKNVVICSPSTLQPILANLRALKINVEISKNIASIIEEIEKLGGEFERFAKRWEVLDKNYETANKARKELNTTVEKITRKSSDILKEAAKKKLTKEEDDLPVYEEEEIL